MLYQEKTKEESIEAGAEIYQDFLLAMSFEYGSGGLRSISSS
jgi:hypothetical protein